MFWWFPWRIIAVDLWLHSGPTLAFTRRIPGLRSETWGTHRVAKLDWFGNQKVRVSKLDWFGNRRFALPVWIGLKVKGFACPVSTGLRRRIGRLP
jgi:hypothetical protein